MVLLAVFALLLKRCFELAVLSLQLADRHEQLFNLVVQVPIP